MTPHDIVERYYSAKLRRHGPGPRGVDWPSTASQYLRFAQLLRPCDFSVPFSLNDLGCGTGALLTYLRWRHPEARVAYHGVDLSPAMVATARAESDGAGLANFRVGSSCVDVADYSVASGVFNIRLGWPIPAWESYVEDILIDLHRHSRRGFAANFLLPDEAPPNDALYRTFPERWAAFVRTRTGRPPTVLADYGLREFTLVAGAG